jgi:hypothetical protein
LRGEGAAAAGSGEEAEEHAGARAPAEHRHRFDGFALPWQFALLLRKGWPSGLGLLMVGLVKGSGVQHASVVRPTHVCLFIKKVILPL